MFGEDGTCHKPDTEEFLRGFMAEFREHVERVRTVLPKKS